MPHPADQSVAEAMAGLVADPERLFRSRCTRPNSRMTGYVAKTSSTDCRGKPAYRYHLFREHQNVIAFRSPSYTRYSRRCVGECTTADMLTSTRWQMAKGIYLKPTNMRDLRLSHHVLRSGSAG